MTIRADGQRLDVGTIVELFEIDARGIGGGRHRFVPGPWGGDAVTYQGQDYTPTPVTLCGLGYAAGGAGPRPTLRVSRRDAAIAGAALGTDAWGGARLTRLRTLSRYLDGETEADPHRHWPAQSWVLDRLVSGGRTGMVWQLAGATDLRARPLPGRQIVRDVCAWRYREHNGTEWVYTRAECPYNGAHLFDAADNPVTDPAEDACSRRLSGCRLRFPGQALPFGAFPGVGRVRS